ncbi:MAG: M23 family metallopeptidase [Thermostichales cyanobacterium SZTDM-1c_bins_54]
MILLWAVLLWFWLPPALGQPLPPPPPASGSLDTVRILTPSLPPLSPAGSTGGLNLQVGRQVRQYPLEEPFGEEIVPVILKERSSGREITIIPGETITISEPQSLLLPDPEQVPAVPVEETLLYPLPRLYPITSPFGWRIHPIRGEPEFHQGTDLGAPAGVAVLAAYSGQVVAAGSMGGLGNGVVIAHSTTSRTRYGHLDVIKVTSGQWVKQGDVIGLVGSTGLTTGPHLHFELWQKQATWIPLDSTEKLLIAQERFSLTS